MTVAVADTTGNNAGNYTATFDPNLINVKWTKFEVYKMIVVNAKASGLVGWNIFIGIHQYEGFQSQGTATWSDPTPMPVDSGENIYFYFDLAQTGVAPIVTLWIQVDRDVARIE